MEIKSIKTSDLERIFDFWQKNYKVSDRDDLDHMKIFLEKNPDLSIYLEEDADMLGTCLSSFDGRKGYIQKVVVSESQQKKGLGKMMVLDVIERLKKAGALDIRVGCDGSLIPFYESCGFKIDNIAHLKIKLYK